MEKIDWLNARFEDLPANAISKKKKSEELADYGGFF